MLRIHRKYYPASPGVRSELVSRAVGACDLCGGECGTGHYDGDTYWSQAMAHQDALGAGFIERMKGVLQQLICPACQTG